MLKLTEILFKRRVHISADTLECLDGVYEVEPGYGTERDNYLKDRNVVTYLIKQVEPLRTKRRYSSRPIIWADDDKNKKSFKINNSLVINNSIGNPHVEDEINVDWTPEIPFGNVCIHFKFIFVGFIWYIFFNK